MKVRQRWPDDGPKIIAVTAYALEGDREKCFEVGMDDYIPRPVQKEDLSRVLSKHRSSNGIGTSRESIWVNADKIRSS